MTIPPTTLWIVSPFPTSKFDGAVQAVVSVPAVHAVLQAPAIAGPVPGGAPPAGSHGDMSMPLLATRVECTRYVIRRSQPSAPSVSASPSVTQGTTPLTCVAVVHAPP